jgi:molybdopterin-biosynthesis enzyme MoeA-like protein
VDDLTAAAAAQAANQPLLRDPVVLDAIKKKYASFGRVMPEENAKQADRPETASVIPNPVGTAPGFALPLGNATCYFMPGVPREMRHLFRESIVPAIASQAERNTHQVHLRTFGKTESRVAGPAGRHRRRVRRHPGLPRLVPGDRGQDPRARRHRGRRRAHRQRGRLRRAAAPGRLHLRRA